MDDWAGGRPVVVAVQPDIVWKNKEANHARVRAMIAEEHPPARSLVVLPEMFATGFCMDVADITETGNGATELFLRDIAKEFGVYIVAGVVSSAPDGLGRNEAVMLDPSGDVIDHYQKIQPFTGSEKENYAPGSRIVQFEWHGLKVSPFICFDLRFPEHFRRAARMGTDLMVVIASWPVARIAHWTKLLEARAIENQCYVVGVNRTGNDPNLPYNGMSRIIDYTGAVMEDGIDEERCIRAKLDPEGLAAYRKLLPFLDEMRPEHVAG